VPLLDGDGHFPDDSETDISPMAEMQYCSSGETPSFEVKNFEGLVIAVCRSDLSPILCIDWDELEKSVTIVRDVGLKEETDDVEGLDSIFRYLLDVSSLCRYASGLETQFEI
jgi:hypothetical protein